MFRIIRIHDDAFPTHRDTIAHVQAILRRQVSPLPDREIAAIPSRLRDPVRHGCRTVLLVAENRQRDVLGLALVSHFLEQSFCFLDMLVGAKGTLHGSLGRVLFERVREEALALGAQALLMKEPSDEPDLNPEAGPRKQARQRIRFYERYGARVIEGTRFGSRLRPKGEPGSVLVFDGLGRTKKFRRAAAKRMVRRLLETRAGRWFRTTRIDDVIASLRDDPIRLREPHEPEAAQMRPELDVAPDERIALIVTDQHAIHHVKDQGYAQSPIRIDAIFEAIKDSGLFKQVKPRRHPERIITAVHDRRYFEYFKKVCRGLPADKSVYPYVFPVRNATRPPTDLPYSAGFYCIDTFTPLNRNAFVAAKRAVDCAMTGANEVLSGRRIAYALVRPPAHHAERRTFGGFCYFNSAAIAAHHLAQSGRVVILDIDYHHGNGQQDIFYTRNDVLTISIHANPHFEYPYFTGFAEETGEGAGEGYNLNLPLPKGIKGLRHREALRRALRRIQQFKPSFLVVALGLDPARDDPSGTWLLEPDDFEENGRMIGRLKLPTLVTQEGGYSTNAIGGYALRFFAGLWRASSGREHVTQKARANEARTG